MTTKEEKEELLILEPENYYERYGLFSFDNPKMVNIDYALERIDLDEIRAQRNNRLFKRNGKDL